MHRSNLGQQELQSLTYRKVRLFIFRHPNLERKFSQFIYIKHVTKSPNSIAVWYTYWNSNMQSMERPKLLCKGSSHPPHYFPYATYNPIFLGSDFFVVVILWKNRENNWLLPVKHWLMKASLFSKELQHLYNTLSSQYK